MIGPISFLKAEEGGNHCQGSTVIETRSYSNFVSDGGRSMDAAVRAVL